MASPVNQHRANCIGTLSFHGPKISAVDQEVCRTKSVNCVGYESMHILHIYAYFTVL